MKKHLIFSRKLTILILTFVVVHFAWGQTINNKEQTKRPFKDRISIGGALGLSFGSNSVLVEVSPMIGYSLTDNFVVGLGLTYKYYQYNDFFQSTSDLSSFSDLKNNIYGGSVFARYFLTGIGVPIIENMFLHAEVEPLIFTSDFKYVSNVMGDYRGADGYFYDKEKEQMTITSYFLGGGLRQMITNRSYLYIEVLWNFNEELYSPYSNPRIRIGIAAGF
jgi:hypothetical protein